MRSPDQAHRDTLDKLPPGWVFPREPDSATGKTLRPLAEEAVRFEEAAEALLEEATPSTTVALLTDYERVLGPDPCLGAVAGTFDERRLSVHQRWTALGGASRAHMIDVAAKLGYAVTIEEFHPPRAGAAGGAAGGCLRAGGACYDAGVVFTWRVHAPPTRVVLFRANDGKAGQALATGGIPWLACALGRAAPAHTTLILAYDGAAA